MATALDIITTAAKLIGVVFKSEALTSDEANDGLNALNDLVASCSNNSLLIYARTWESFSVAAAASYTIGPSQTLNTVRPIAIRDATINFGGIDYPLAVITDEQYGNIGLKTLSSQIPAVLNYDNGYPAAIIRLYPALSTSATLNLLTEKAVSGFGALTTTVDLPPGWKRALTYNLALDLHPQYYGPETQVPQTVVRGATDSLRNITLAVAKNRPIKFMPRSDVHERYSIFSDY